MLSKEEISRIYREAYLPEHLPDYTSAISGANPFLHGNYLCLTQQRHLILIGYPLGDQTSDLSVYYKDICDRFQPDSVSIIAPELGVVHDQTVAISKDNYLVLDLPLAKIPPDVGYMLRRARRDLAVCQGTFAEEHHGMIEAFIATHDLSEAHRLVFRNISKYLDKSSSAYLLEARRGGALVAFTIVDLGTEDFAFYLFNFRSNKIKCPGASDLLFYEMVCLAQQTGKKNLNLGLGVNEGILRFKQKWGCRPFLPYEAAILSLKRSAWGMFKNIFR